MPYRFIPLFIFCAFAAALSAQPSRKIKLNPVTLDLPQSYKERTFIKGLAGFVNNIDQLVGAMILIEDNKNLGVHPLRAAGQTACGVHLHLRRDLQRQN